MNFKGRSFLYLESNTIVMKRILITGVAFILLACGFTACEALGSCKICRQVTYVNGVVDIEGEETEYCDADLTTIEQTDDYVSGNTRISWECR